MMLRSREEGRARGSRVALDVGRGRWVLKTNENCAQMMEGAAEAWAVYFGHLPVEGEEQEKRSNIHRELTK